MERVALTIRLSPKMAAKLKALAAHERRSLSGQVEKLVEAAPSPPAQLDLEERSEARRKRR